MNLSTMANLGRCLTLSAAVLTLAAVVPARANGQGDTSSPDAPSVAEEHIAAVTASLSRALAAGDGAAAGALYTEDAILLPPDGEMIKGWQRISDYWQGGVEGGLRHLDATTYEVFATDRIATEVGRYRIFDDEGLVTQNGKYMNVWKLVGGRWMLHRMIWNLTLQEE